MKIFKVGNKRIQITRNVFLPIASGWVTIRVGMFRGFPFLRVPFKASICRYYFRFGLCGTSNFVRLNSGSLNLKIVANIVLFGLQTRVAAEIVNVNFRNRYNREGRVGSVSILRHAGISMTRDWSGCVNCTAVVAYDDPRPRHVVVSPLSIGVVMFTRDIRGSIYSQATIGSVSGSI